MHKLFECLPPTPYRPRQDPRWLAAWLRFADRNIAPGAPRSVTSLLCLVFSGGLLAGLFLDLPWEASPALAVMKLLGLPLSLVLGICMGCRAFLVPRG